MLKKIDHIGIAVKDLDEIQKTMIDAFDLSPEFKEQVKDQKVDVLGYKVGDSIVEYLAPSSDDSPISKYLEKHGSGLHHIAYRVTNLENSLKNLKKKGFKLIDEVPRDGADGKRIAFIHPKSSNGILIELCETKER